MFKSLRRWERTLQQCAVLSAQEMCPQSQLLCSEACRPFCSCCQAQERK